MRPNPTAAPLSPAPASTDETFAAITRALPCDRAVTPAQTQSEREDGAAMIAALRPRDPLEAGYAVRAAAALFGSLECLRRARLPALPENVAFRLQGNAVARSRMNTDLIGEVMPRQAASGGRHQAASGQVAAKPAAEAGAVGQPEGGPNRGVAPSTHVTRAGGQGHTAAGAAPAGDAGFDRQDSISSERRPSALGAALMARLEAARATAMTGPSGDAAKPPPTRSTHITRTEGQTLGAAGAGAAGGS